MRIHVSRFSGDVSGTNDDVAPFEAWVSEELTRSEVFGRANAVLAVRNADDRAPGDWMRQASAALRSVGRLALRAQAAGLVLLAEVDEAGVAGWVERRRPAVSGGQTPRLSGPPCAFGRGAVHAVCEGQAGSAIHGQPWQRLAKLGRVAAILRPIRATRGGTHVEEPMRSRSPISLPWS